MTRTKASASSNAEVFLIISEGRPGRFGTRFRGGFPGNRFWNSLAGVVIFFACLLSSVSAEEVFRLEEVLSATRRLSVLEQTSAFGEVLSQEVLARSTALALDELLTNARHAQLRSYGPGGLSSLQLRGASSAQVLVLVDGERLNDSQSGGMDLSQILLSGVQRIEILRGGQSALYGADAMGGILYIVTRPPDGPRLNVGSTLGSFGHRGWQVNLGHRWRNLSGGLSYTADRGAGDFPFTDLYGRSRRRKNAAYSRQEARLRLDWRGPGHLQFTAERYEGDHGVPGPIGQPSPSAHQWDRSGGVRLHWTQDVGERFRYVLRTYVRQRRLRYRDPGPFDIDALHRRRVMGLEAQGTRFWRVSDERMPLIFGFGVRREQIRSTSIGDRERTAIGAYLQQEWTFHRWTFFPAFRLDLYSDFRAGWSPKLGWRYALDDHLALKGNVGRSYRAPTFNDLYWPEDGFARGNPNLRPERSIDCDLGIQGRRVLRGMTLSGSVVAFTSHFRDRILWAPVAGGKWTPANLNRATHRGLETELRLQRSPLEFEVSHTLLDARDERGKQLIYTARHTFRGSLGIRWNGFWARWMVHYESKRYTTRANTRFLDPFLTHDVQVGFHRSVGDRGRLTISGEIRNVLDTPYQHVKDYPLPGREIRFKLTLQQGGRS